MTWATRRSGKLNFPVPMAVGRLPMSSCVHGLFGNSWLAASSEPTN